MGEPCVANLFDLFLEEVLSLSALTEELELIQVQQASLVLVNCVEELLDVL